MDVAHFNPHSNPWNVIGMFGIHQKFHEFQEFSIKNGLARIGEGNLAITHSRLSFSRFY